MLKLLKYFFLTLLLVIGLLFLLLHFFVDEAAIKQQLIEQVDVRSNGQLQIDGELKLAIFPELGLSLNQLRYTLDGDGDSDAFASLDSLSMGLKVIPLLNGSVQVDEVLLHGLQLNLQQDKSGKGNWQGLMKDADTVAAEEKTKAASGAQDSGEATAMALSVDRVDIRDANIRYRDEAAGTDYALQDFSLQSQAITLDGQGFPLSVAFTVALSEPRLNLDVKLSTQLSVDQANEHYELASVDSDIGLQGEMTEDKPWQLQASLNSSIDLAKETLQLSAMQLSLNGIELKGEASVAQWSEALTANATISLLPFNPRKTLAAFNIELPVLSSPKAMTALSMDSAIAYRDNHLAISNLSLKLDDSLLQGEVIVEDIDKQQLKAVLQPIPSPLSGQFHVMNTPNSGYLR